MKVSSEVEKLSREVSLPKILSPYGYKYTDKAREALGYIAFMKKMVGCEEQITWIWRKEIYSHCAQTLTEKIERFMGILTRKDGKHESPHHPEVELKQACEDFRIASLVYGFIVNRMYLRYPKPKRVRSRKRKPRVRKPKSSAKSDG